MLNHKLHRTPTTVLIDVQAVGNFDLFNRLVRPDVQVDIESDSIEYNGALCGEQHQLQVFLTYQPLTDNAKNTVKYRLGELLATGTGETQGGREVEIKICLGQFTIGLVTSLQCNVSGMAFQLCDKRA